jgi:hypothetical protein
MAIPSPSHAHFAFRPAPSCTSMSTSMASSPPMEHILLRSALKRDSSRQELSDLAGGESLTVPGSETSTPQSSSRPHTSFSGTAPGYTNKVSFDTFESSSPGDTSMFSFTLKVPHWHALTFCGPSLYECTYLDDDLGLPTESKHAGLSMRR